MAYRMTVESDGRIHRLLLGEGDHLVGSGSDCDAVLAHPTVSRRQARLSVAGDRIEIEDLGSRNGTTVDGRSIDAVTSLTPGCLIRFGSLRASLEKVADGDLEPAPEIGPARRPASVPAAVRDTETLVDAPALVFARDALAPLLRRVAEGQSATSVAQAAGVALADALHATDLEIAVGDEAPGVVFHRRGTVASEGASEATQRAGDVAIRVTAPGEPGTWKPLLEAVALLVAIAEKNGEPSDQPPQLSHAAEPPDPPTVEQEVVELYRDAARIAAGDVSVLIRGESGTGKELLARFIHDASPRADGPFEAVNCAALPRDLLEAELFGIERGVATGVNERTGRIEAADGGTLFLDEIGDMSTETQAAILRALQERSVYRVGGRTPKPVDVRVVAATNRDLDGMLADGRFRTDLYHRIADWDVVVPALRLRPGDVPNLAAWFLARELGRRGLTMYGISRAALEALADHDWPGNIRQLEREMARAALFLEDGELLETRHLSDEIRASVVKGRGAGLAGVLEATECREIRRALRETDGDVPAAAELLGVGRSTLYRRLGELGIDTA